MLSQVAQRFLVVLLRADVVLLPRENVLLLLPESVRTPVNVAVLPNAALLYVAGFPYNIPLGPYSFLFIYVAFSSYIIYVRSFKRFKI
jgi:hypothetical protein